MRFLQIETVVPPAGEVVTVADFIDHARLNGLTVDRQPNLIERELKAATARGEQYCRRSFLTQTLNAFYVPDGLTCACTLLLFLPRGKVQKVNALVSGGAALDPALYSLEWNTVKLQSPLPGSAAVEFVSGYGDEADDVPDGIKEGILEYATILYESRSGERDQKYAAMSGQGLPDGVRDLWRPFQIEISG
jgi:uncharacterized phiE125 gp8 family phage protein